MRKFEEPIVSISVLEVSDIITTSTECVFDCADHTGCPAETMPI